MKTPKKPNLAHVVPVYIESLKALENGIANLIRNAKLRKDNYDIGYLTTMQEDVKAMIKGPTLRKIMDDTEKMLNSSAKKYGVKV